MTIEQKVRAIMRATEWPQQKLAEYFGVSQSTVNRWLAGSEPEGHRRDAINEAYDKYVGQSEPSEDPHSIWLRRMKRVFDRLEGAPDHLFRQIVSYAEGVADTYENTRDTATTPDS